MYKLILAIFSLTFFLSCKDSNANNQEVLIENKILALRNEHKDFAADVMIACLKQKYPDFKSTADIKAQQELKYSSLTEILQGIAGAVVDTTSATGINNDKAHLYIESVESLVFADPSYQNVDQLLFGAGEMARSIRQFDKAISIYDQVIMNYPNSDKAPMAYFVKGFTIENELRNIESAKAVYQEFLNKYPDHSLSKDVKFLLDNAGKSDEELMKAIQK